jgi:hypothetical protein
VVLGADGALLVLDGDLLSRLRVKDELEKSTSDETRSKVSWKVMMQEKLSSHEEEGEVVSSPGKEEEAGRVIQAGAGTAVKRVNSTAEGDLVSKKDTGVHSEKTAGKPPTNRVTEEVDLLASLVLSPEADTAKQERPLVRVAGIGVAAGKLAVVVEHSALKLEPLLKEWNRLDLALRLLATRAVDGDRRNVFSDPNVGAGCNLLVTVDLLLLVAPLGQRLGVSPHGDLAWVVDELEVTGDRLEVLVLLAVLKTNLEKGVLLTLTKGLLGCDSSELLVGRVVRRGNIVREEDLVGANVAKTDQVVVLDDATKLLIVVGGPDLPVVVGVVVRVTGNLLALARNTAIVVSERVTVLVTVEVGLGLLVADGDTVVVLNIDRVGQHDVVAQGLLELGGHEVVTGTRSVENSEVNLEPEQVEQERHDDQTEGTSSKVLAELLQADSTTGSIDVEEVPEINDNGRANGNESKDTDILDRDIARKSESGKDKPLPPLAGEGLMSKLVPLDVEEKTAGHGKDEGRIQEDKSGLSNVGIVEEQETGGKDTGGEAVTRLPHDEVCNGDGQGTEGSGQSSESHVRDLVRNVGVSNVIEVEVAIVTDEPANKSEKKLAERRVDIEEVGSLEVVGRELSKMNLVKNDLVRVADTPESGHEGQDSDNCETNLVLGLALDSGPLSTSFGKFVKLRAGVEIVVGELL